MRRKSTREEILEKIAFHQKNKKEAQKEYKERKKEIVKNDSILKAIFARKNTARVSIQNYQTSLRKLDRE
jgi:hypothetical protein